MQDFSYNRPIRTRRRKQRNAGKVFFFLFFVSFMFYQVAHSLLATNVKKPVIIDPTADAIPAEVLADSTKSKEPLRDAVYASLEGTKGAYAVVIKNLATGETFSMNEHRIFQPGSLYKLWIMGTAFEQIQKGQLRSDQDIHEDVATLNKKFGIVSESAELKDGTVDFTVGTAINQMITISHNYAALLLTEKIKLSNVAAFLTENDFRESQIGKNNGSPITTAYDTAQFFEKLYLGKILSPAYSEEMLAILKRQQLNNKLPKYLPDDLEIAHKTGEIDTFTHDAGIVYLPKQAYVIVVLSESKDPDLAEERIAGLSLKVYDYFLQEK